MSDVAIRVENLTKKFYLGERVGIKTFREALQDLVTAPFRIWKKDRNGETREKVDTEREIWALKGVSFEVKHGEVLGIIGPNGAGKSTLLKILSRITEPTGGYAEIRGRVGSLLEVGTGFHPELTGRENVYLNGAILGMSKAEIRRKFDDIVSFAGVEKFIDTPVKRYSSGMQVRLAFAVAAHLEPEILIIDEVLAVGDAEFQKRCLGKMNEVSRSGRTVLFVSHNMAAVEALCARSILLKSGVIRVDGKSHDVIVHYLQPQVKSDPRRGFNFSGSFFEIIDLSIEALNSPRIVPRCCLVVSLVVAFRQPCSSPYVHLVVRSNQGQPLFGFGTDDLCERQFFCDSSIYQFRFHIEKLPLLPGDYSVMLRICARDARVAEVLDLGHILTVEHTPVYGNAVLTPEWHGMIAVDVTGEVRPLSENAQHPNPDSWRLYVE